MQRAFELFHSKPRVSATLRKSCCHEDHRDDDDDDDASVQFGLHHGEWVLPMF